MECLIHYIFVEWKDEADGIGEIRKTKLLDRKDWALGCDGEASLGWIEEEMGVRGNGNTSCRQLRCF